MPSCNQCGKPAVAVVANNPLCVDCLLKLQQAIQIQDARYVQEMNYLIDSMEATVGLYGVLPKYQVPQPIIHQGALTFHNIKVDQSVIGSINTGEAKRIDVCISHIKTSGNKELVKALKDFTEAIIAETKLSNDLKNQILEQTSFLTSQSLLPKEKRKTAIIKAVLPTLKNTVSTIASLSLLWGKLQPLLERIFA